MYPIAVPWWNACTSRNAPRCDWSYGLTGSSIEIQGGPLARVRAARTAARIRVCMATSQFGLPVGCRPSGEGLRCRDSVDGPVVRQDVQLAAGILAERQYAAEVHLEGPARLGRHGPAGIGEAANPSRAVVGVEIPADQPRRGAAAVH